MFALSRVCVLYLATTADTQSYVEASSVLLKLGTYLCLQSPPSWHLLLMTQQAVLSEVLQTKLAALGDFVRPCGFYDICCFDIHVFVKIFFFSSQLWVLQLGSDYNWTFEVKLACSENKKTMDTTCDQQMYWSCDFQQDRRLGSTWTTVT